MEFIITTIDDYSVTPFIMFFTIKFVFLRLENNNHDPISIRKLMSHEKKDETDESSNAFKSTSKPI